MEKTRFDWVEEAENFVAEWRKATNEELTLTAFLEECDGLDLEYLSTLWGYISDILHREEKKKCLSM